MFEVTHNLYCIVGMSGSGKTTLADRLCQEYPGTHSVVSCTTRPKRTPDENDYHFLSDSEYEAADLVQHASFAGYKYGATRDELNQSSWFVVCPEGIPELYENYPERDVVVIYLETSPEVRYQRMIARGDTPEAAQARIDHDEKSFGTIEDDSEVVYIDGNRDMDAVFQEVKNIIEDIELEYHFEKYCDLDEDEIDAYSED